MSVFILVPAYNEEQVIRQTLQSLLPLGHQIVVIDDGSTDDTRQQLHDLPIHLLTHMVNLGQGAALQTGMHYALSAGAEIVVHFDSDGQHQASDIAALIQPILDKEADLVLGSRFLSDQPSGIPLSRKILLKSAIVLNGLLTGLWLSDAHNGLRAMNRKALTHIHIRENRMAHATEILSEIKKHGLRFKEVPVFIQYSAYAKAKGQSGWNAFNILSDLILHKLFSR
ncbi:MAG: glycosyltransferase family 2 protein [Bacteroidota bacterium]